ncbi:hypothetical protein EDF56_102183 [Novosphingobium sp. PhB165]|uniref:GFA family protein n=1 Tax=Novosphingobium sp. PhB165 TaxID=2485105 RepID=UPI0010D11E05|nr:GFA family protein [Novosphingobium sp. PhB165]TCM20522.1 hypothetical protein EDF56_102183 [Novosphingobium sp. PhB165]
MIEAECRCGAVGLEIEGSPVFQVYCHCSDCQLAHGAAYALNAVYAADAVQVIRGAPASGQVRTTPRMRCGACGTHLFTEVAVAGLRSLNAYLLPKEQFAPQFHLHCEDAVLPVVDDLPHYRRLPAAFGGSDDVVDW